MKNGDSDLASKLPGKNGLENGVVGVERGLNAWRNGHHDEELQKTDPGTDSENEDNENNENDEEEEDDNEGPFVPFRCPGSHWQSIEA